MIFALVNRSGSHSDASQKTRDTIPDDLLLVGTRIELRILEHRDGHAAVARVDDV